MRNVYLCILFCFLTVLQTLAQTTENTAGISGTVLDPDGKVVQNASVVATNESTHTNRVTVTDAEGRFSFSDLSTGLYSIDVTAAGFATVHRGAVRAAAGATENISIPLTLEKVSEEVTVSEFLPLS